jgi:hypothetical protein
MKRMGRTGRDRPGIFKGRKNPEICTGETVQKELSTKGSKDE